MVFRLPMLIGQHRQPENEPPPKFSLWGFVLRFIEMPCPMLNHVSGCRK
ncbi:hypothetical protein GCWU000324_02999 [Kingella oralis ATCC 51147]|uniref:Uncharacterized protein n=1 Tax=Kingella oralis ATCC 51147 TaxID=629741 RepID=C4GMR3_9NEIS|nr:hypothetical protein GCWU000324_02999 [Kingella oralis ATCC 51147]